MPFVFRGFRFSFCFVIEQLFLEMFSLYKFMVFSMFSVRRLFKPKESSFQIIFGLEIFSLSTCCFSNLERCNFANIKQDGNVPSRGHILGSKIFKEQLLEKFGKNFFFKKNIFDFFFRKKYFLSRTMPKNSKRGHSGSFNVFYKPKTSKKMQGGTL